MEIPRVVAPHEVAASGARFDEAFALSETETPSAWLERCARDQAQLWACGNFWVITEVVGGKRGRVLHFVAAEGEFDQRLIDHIEAWACGVGCTTAYFTGRKGWLRRMPDYALDKVTLKKELGHA